MVDLENITRRFKDQILTEAELLPQDAGLFEATEAFNCWGKPEPQGKVHQLTVKITTPEDLRHDLTTQLEIQVGTDPENQALHIEPGYKIALVNYGITFLATRNTLTPLRNRDVLTTLVYMAEGVRRTNLIRHPSFTKDGEVTFGFLDFFDIEKPNEERRKTFARTIRAVDWVLQGYFRGRNKITGSGGAAYFNI